MTHKDIELVRNTLKRYRDILESAVNSGGQWTVNTSASYDEVANRQDEIERAFNRICVDAESFRDI